MHATRVSYEIEELNKQWKIFSRSFSSSFESCHICTHLHYPLRNIVSNFIFLLENERKVIQPLEIALNKKFECLEIRAMNEYAVQILIIHNHFQIRQIAQTSNHSSHKIFPSFFLYFYLHSNVVK